MYFFVILFKTLHLPSLLLLLQSHPYTLKNVNLIYQFFIFFFLNFNPQLGVSVKACQNLQNSLLFYFFKKKIIKIKKNSGMCIFTNSVES